MNDENNNKDNESPEPVDELASLKAERDDLLARLQRVSADYLNYQKRAQREADESRQFANTELMKALLSPLDDLQRAVEHARANHPADDPLLVGTQLVYLKMLETLKRYGLEQMTTEGKMFDPSQHEALLMQPTAEAEPGAIIAEARKGYMLRGRTIRPAQVIVAASPVPDIDSSADRTESEES